MRGAEQARVLIPQSLHLGSTMSLNQRSHSVPLGRGMVTSPLVESPGEHTVPWGYPSTAHTCVASPAIPDDPNVSAPINTFHVAGQEEWGGQERERGRDEWVRRGLEMADCGPLS